MFYFILLQQSSVYFILLYMKPHYKCWNTVACNNVLALYNNDKWLD